MPINPTYEQINPPIWTPINGMMVPVGEDGPDWDFE